MSEGMNKVYLLGNLGADPELRQTSGGELLRLRLATNERWLDKNQERQERVEWHTVILWGKRAAALSRILTKGSRVMVEGNLRTSSYEKDGATRYSTEIRASNVFLAGWGREGPQDRGRDDQGTDPFRLSNAHEDRGTEAVASA